MSRATKNRPARPVADVATTLAGLRRQLIAIADRPLLDDAGQNDVIDLPALEQFDALVATASAAMNGAVQHLRGLGYSWSQIGGALGITKQSAQQRFSR